MRKETHRDVVKGWHPFTDEEIERYVSKGFFPNKTVGDLLDRNAETFPNKLAIADDNTEVTWNYNDINLPGGDFTTNLVRTRVSYSFNPRISLQGLLQYNDRADLWSVGMHVFGLCDAVIKRGSDDDAACFDLTSFLGYTLLPEVVIVDGDYAGDYEGSPPRFLIRKEVPAFPPPGSPLHNPYGRWRLELLHDSP